ncbi:MAG: signal peptidase I [Candidatus Buchananbacteria bacterium RIFCSPLOWO2_01_FULL_46_12]|uniref:Signal peptidase I n=2 Tax=Candidatus Buchananiibacteriota TaxID=1817903 RepID=A0A1G1YNR4_9BACT|nr:MAG: signal peptidase I [Candidatus Buchananbacteria bacterium RIFCSPLOWO2_01_FULL_46_12]
MVIEQLQPIETTEEKPKRPAKKKKPLWRKILGTVLYLAFVFGLVYYTPKALSNFLGTDYPLAAITSGSMWPELKKGDLIFIQGVKDAKKEIQVGEVIVYSNERNAFTIHRVIELKEDELITKGDANNISDQPISYTDVIGRLYKIGNYNARIPKLGFVSTSFSQFIKK